jgi:hypothetical protein
MTVLVIGWRAENHCRLGAAGDLDEGQRVAVGIDDNRLPAGGTRRLDRADA